MKLLIETQELSDQIDKEIEDYCTFDAFGYTELNRVDLKKLYYKITNIALRELLAGNIINESIQTTK